MFNTKKSLNLTWYKYRNNIFHFDDLKADINRLIWDIKDNINLRYMQHSFYEFENFSIFSIMVNDKYFYCKIKYNDYKYTISKFLEITEIQLNEIYSAWVNNQKIVDL